MLLKSVYTVFANEVSFTESALVPYLSLNNPPFNPESIPARHRFLARRIKLIQNLLRWRKFTGERFGIGQLITKLVDRCIIPVAECGWDVGGEERIRQVRGTSLQRVV
jgi:GC-rich sequence DNA-binding factor